MYFRSSKLRFEHFFVNCKVKVASFKQFILCSNLFSKLEKSCIKEAIFILQLAIKMLKKQFLGAKIQIFEIRCWLRSHIFFWVRIPWGEIFDIFPTLVLEKKVWVADIFTECSFLFLTYYSTLKKHVPDKHNFKKRWCTVSSSVFLGHFW